MKHLLFLIALWATLPLGAQTTPQTGESLVGVWQQVQYAKKDGHLMKLPVWKVMQSDGSFCTFLIANETGQSVITNLGTYEQTSDTTFVEHISGSITDPQLVGKSNVLSYTLKEGDKLSVSYRVPGASRETHEAWLRVKLEMPEQ